MICCFLGHREIYETEELREKVSRKIEELIIFQGVDTFLFGSKSQFIRLCYKTVTDLKEKYPHIKRVYVRAEFPVIDEDYRGYLLESYEDTFYPECLAGAGRAIYVKRNMEMVKQSDICLFYCDAEYIPKGRKSGTKIALDYAEKQKKTVYRFDMS